MNILNLFRKKPALTQPQKVLTEEDLIARYPRRPQPGEIWKLRGLKDPFDPPEETIEVLELKQNWVRFNHHMKQRTEHDERWAELDFLFHFEFHSDKI